MAFNPATARLESAGPQPSAASTKFDPSTAKLAPVEESPSPVAKAAKGLVSRVRDSAAKKLGDVGDRLGEAAGIAKAPAAPKAAPAFNPATAAPAPDTDRTAGQVASDLGKKVAAGAYATAGSLGDVYGLVSGDVDNKLSKAGAEGQARWDARTSPELKAMEAERKAKIDAAPTEFSKAGTALWETLKSPSLLTAFLSEQAPMLLPSGIVGRASARVAQRMGATANTAGKIGTGAAVGTGAAQQGADAGTDAYERLMELPDELWQESEEYRGMVDAGAAPDDAKAQIALSLSRNATIASAVASGALNLLPGARVLEGALAGAKSKAGSRAARAVQGFVGESLQEGLEEGAGKVASNHATQQIDPETGTYEGVGEAAGLGAAAGPFGAIAGLVEGREKAPPPKRGASDKPAKEGVLERADGDTKVDPDRVVEATMRGEIIPVNRPGLVQRVRKQAEKEKALTDQDTPASNIDVSVRPNPAVEAAPPPKETLSREAQFELEDELEKARDKPKSNVEVTEEERDVESIDVDAAPLPTPPTDGITVEEVDAAAHEAATSPKNDLPEPTEAQKEAGNYKKGHLRIDGHDITIENPAGSKRSGVDPDGKPWSVDMQNHYGYIKRTEGADGDHVDTFIRDGATESPQVYVVDQVNRDGTFDEHKVIMGALSVENAKEIYLQNYEDGWRGLGAIEEMGRNRFAEWLKDPQATKEPVRFLERHDGPDGTEVVITKGDKGFHVTLRDTDAAETVGVAAITSTIEQARAKAKELTTGPKAQENTTDFRTRAAEPKTPSEKPDGSLELTGNKKPPKNTGIVAKAREADKSKRNEISVEELARDGDGNWSPYLLADGRVVSTKGDHSAFIESDENYDGDNNYGDYAIATGAVRFGAWFELNGDYFISAQVFEGQGLTEKQIQTIQEIQSLRPEAKIMIGMTPASDKSSNPPQYTEMSMDEVRGLSRPETSEVSEKSVTKSDAPTDNLPAKRKEMFVQWGGRKYPVRDFQDASEKWNTVRETSGAGSSELGADPIIVDESGKEIARISYNGRVWPPGERKPGEKSLYDPVGRKGIPNEQPKLADGIDTAPAEEPTVTPEPETAPTMASEPPLRIEDYTEKSIIVRGDTRDHKDTIKAIGGALWNRRAKGWVFPKRRRDVVEKALAGLLGDSEPAVNATPAAEKASTSGGGRTIGQNADGSPVMEDKYGVRSVLEDGVVITENVTMVPTPAGVQPSVNTRTRGDRFKTTDELTGEKGAIEKGAIPPNQAVDNATEKKADAPTFGAGNTVFTEDAAEKARAILKKKLGTLNSGIDPETMQAGITLAGYYIEGGARSFAEYSKRMVGDLGEEIRPYLKSFYEAVRNWPGFDPEGMTPAGEIGDETAKITAEVETDGIPDSVPAGDEGASTADVQRTDAERSDAEAPAGENAGSVPAESGVDDGRPDERPRDTDGPRRGTRSRGTSARGDAGLPAARNHVIEPGALDEARGPAKKARDNIRAIELSRELKAEGRNATPEEQAELALYVGWGGLSGAFPDGDGNFGKGFEQIGPRVRELLSDTEYETARRSIQYAHYTSETVIRSMWNAASQLGFTGGKVFEPGMGVGHFAGLMPETVATRTDYNGLELDHITAQIARQLYPKSGIRQDDFTRAPLPENTYDLVIGNPPFADVPIKSDPKYAAKSFLLHDYFFAKSLDAVRPGGLLMFISSAGTMNKIDTKAREYMAERADLVGAIRLPSTAFKQNAGTEVTTDIIILRKKTPGFEFDRAVAADDWVPTIGASFETKDGGQADGAANAYFAGNPRMVLGREGFFDKLYPNRYGVQPIAGAVLEDQLRDAIALLPSDVMTDWQDEHSHDIVDFATEEKKDGSYYLADGKLMQFSEGVGRPVERRGKGVTGGQTKDAIDKITALIPIRDALRAVYTADLAGDAANAARARQRLNETYDAFVKKNGPINLAKFTYRRPNRVQSETARAAAREEARYNGIAFDEGSFDPTDMIAAGASTSEIARARRQAKEKAEEAGETWDEGSFDPEDQPDIVTDKRPNIDPFIDDPESYRLRAIERYDEASGVATKGLVFDQSVISLEKAPEINSVGDAMLFVLNRDGYPDIDEIAEAAGVTREEALNEVGDSLFELPGAHGVYETRDDYLSGNVRAKLAEAEKAAERDDRFRKNVEALRLAQPQDLPPSMIAASLGMPWIPERYINEFATSGDGLGLEDADIKYRAKIAEWEVTADKSSAAAVSTWGTKRMPADEILRNALNRMPPKVFDAIPKEGGGYTRVLNPTDTEAAVEKLEAVKTKFSDWIYKDQKRADDLATIYNEQYNNLRAWEGDGSYLTTPGVSAEWSWRPHQLRVIARILRRGNTYMGHAVGAGKTSAMIGAGMEMRRLGMARKPMYAVPNHMLAQFTKEFYEQYPTAKIMVADERRFHTHRRKQFIADVANQDLDAVILTHSALGKIPVSSEFQDQIINEQIDDYREILAEYDAKDPETRLTRKRVEKAIERLEQRLSGKMRRNTDQVFTFEEMGVDMLFVDEAHLYRKLDFATRMSGVKGISPEGSKASMDLYTKVRYLRSQNPQRHLVLASGTPITNTMAELYSVSRYLQEDELADRGLAAFDAWAAAFGDTVTEAEQDPAGGYKQQTRFAKFVNVPELSVMVRQTMDVVTSNELAQYVTRPTIKGGSRKLVLAEKSDALERYQESLKGRMVAISNRRGPPKKGDDILLSVINDGRHAAIDMRFVDPSIGVTDPPSKLDMAVNNVFSRWEQGGETPLYQPGKNGYSEEPVDYGPATQMFFANLGVGGAREFNTYRYIVSELVRRGVPRDEIAIIGDYKTHVARQRLFNDMNEGKVRILIGSTAKMATGVNAQRRLAVIHNLDPLWYPADDEQRIGRGLRQGNMNREIEVLDYSTKGTYDSQMWNLMEKKARFIEGFFRGDPSMRDMDDLGEASQYEQAKAITTNDPRLITLTNLKQELERAVRRRDAFETETYNARTRVQRADGLITRRQADIERMNGYLTRRVETAGDKFIAQVGDTLYKDRAEYGKALLKQRRELSKAAKPITRRKIGEIGGFDVSATVSAREETVKDDDGVVQMDSNGHPRRQTVYGTQLFVDFDEKYGEPANGTSAAGLVAAMEDAITGIDRDIARAERDIAQAEKDIDDFSPRINETFQGGEKIEELQRQVREIQSELNAEATAEKAATEANAAAEADEQNDDGKFARQPRRSESEWLEVMETANGPAYIGPDVTMFPAGAEGAGLWPGGAVYSVVDTQAGDRLGETVVGIEDGEIRTIYWIKATEKGRGAGKRVMRAVTANSSKPVVIDNIMESAQSFWDRIGIYDQQDINAKIDYDSFTEAVAEGAGLREGVRPGEQDAGTAGRRARDAAPSLTPDEARAYLEERVGKRAITRLIDSGRFRIAATSDGNIPADVKQAASEYAVHGYYDANTDTTWLFSDNLTNAGRRVGDLEDAYGVFLHEVGVHYGLYEMLGEKLFDEVVQRTNNALKSKADTELARAVRLARGRVTKAGTPENQIAEETLAWLVTDRANHTLPLVKRLIAKIRAFLVRLGFTGAITPDALVELARGAARRAGAPRENSLFAAGRFSRTPVTSTPEFKRWFGDSKVVDENGDPKVVYHGTDADFSDFSNTEDIGFHFGTDAATANRRIRQSGMSEGANIMPVYLSIKNPLRLPDLNMWEPLSVSSALVDAGVITNEEADAADIVDREQVAEWLENKGYDGIVYANLTEGGRRLKKDEEPNIEITKNSWLGRGAGIEKSYVATRPAEAGGGTLGYGQTREMARENAIKYLRGGNRLPVDSYIALRPEQIKSTTGNRGTFDPENANIMFARTPRGNSVEESPEMNESLRARASAAFEPWIDHFRHEAQDRFHYLKKAQREAEALRGEPLTESEDAYLAELRYHGMAGAAIEDLQRDHVDPLLEVIKDAGIDIATTDRYLHARHAREANAQLQRINPTQEELIDRMAEAEAAGDRAMLARLANYTPFEGDNTALSGMSNEEAAQIMAEARENGTREALEDIGRRVDAMTRANRRLLVESGLETQGTIDAWESVYDNYVPLKREGFDESLPRRGRGYDTRGKQKRRTGSQRGVEHILANVVAQSEATIMRAEKAKVGRAMLEFARNNPDLGLVDVNRVEKKPSFTADGLVTYRDDPGYILADNVFVVRKNGVDHHLTFNESSVEAMKIARSLKNLGAEESGVIVNVLTKFTRLLALLNTGANPEFVISNFARDIQTAGFNLSDTDADALKWKIIGDVGKAWHGIRRFQKGRGGEWAEIYDEFRKAGGQTGWMDHYNDIQDREKALINKVRSMSDGAPAKVKRGLNAIGKFITDENTAVENAIRLAAFKHARENGISEAEAARLAKELTVNFNRRGDMGKTLNALYMFFNASIQGQARILQAISRSSKVRKLVLATVAFATVLDILNRAMAEGDDDEPNPYDAEVMKHIKDRNLVLMLPGGEYVKIPLPWGYNVFHVMGQVIGETLTKPGANIGDGAARVAGATIDAFNPVGGSVSVLQFLSPTIIDPIAQWNENKDWAGRPLRPGDNPFGVDKPDSQKYWGSVRSGSRMVTDFLNSVTGGDEIRPGAIDWSPESIDLMIDTFTGGAGRFAADLVGTPWKALKGEDVESYEIPLLRKVFGIPGMSAVSQNYYQYRDAIALTDAQFRHYRSDPEKRRQIREEHAVEFRLIAKMKAAEKQLRGLRKARRLTDDEEKIREINERIKAVMERFNIAYYRALQ